jgi:hypothetical protein
MPGARGSSTTYYVARVAPKDGTVIGAVEVQQIIAKTYATPRRLVETTRAVIGAN